ncbi:MAG: hypothetical protein JNN05_05715 [Candidatus Omnitrophica bacterium]|nr:hypothetical protein [Candidatus Omnitrophota bacterium]
MKIDLRTIEPMNSLMQFTHQNVNFDFHNFYQCHKVLFEKDKIILRLKHLKEPTHVQIAFSEVLLEKVEFNANSSSNGFTIDQLYRGRYEKEGKLIELSDLGKVYLYLEFCEGLNLEFWCTSMFVE